MASSDRRNDSNNARRNISQHDKRPSSSSVVEPSIRLPVGGCNYRDLTAGPKPPACGCRRFWLGPTFGRVGLGVSQIVEPWCACGHHACFHESKEGTQSRDKRVTSSLTSRESIESGPGSVNWQQETVLTQPWLQHTVSEVDQVRQSSHLLAPQPSGQPALPSFHLTSSELRGPTQYNGTIGLGLDFRRGIYSARKVSQSPTVADAASLDDVPSTRQTSTDDRVSPSDAFMRHILDGRQEALRLQTNGGINSTRGLGLGDILQSATEVATPSIEQASYTTGPARLVQDATEVVKILEQGIAAVGADRSRTSTPPNVHRSSAPGDRELSQRSDSVRSTQAIQDALRQIPAALQRLAPLLNSLQTQVARNPDLSIHESIISLVRRMDALENASFNQLPAEQVHDQFQHIDMRLSELEARTDEHGRLIAAFDTESERSVSHTTTKRITTEHASFTSHASIQSLDSATSSALIAAAIDRVEAAGRLKAVEDRLDTLETMQMPSAALPSEVEVVVLPWGRDLRGIWYEASQMKSSAIAQDEEDWTQAQSANIMTRAPHSLSESGWNDRSIRDWAADDEEDALWSKACGPNSVVYHRLKSRGLVRRVTLTGPGSRDIVMALVKTFGELLQTISERDHEDAMEEDSDEDGLLGLTAPFLPLRKIHKSSCLRFLTEAELITPTLWTAEFLAAGVLMRASAGQKRLYITTRTGYTQGDADGWTWSALRQLPRVHDAAAQKASETAVPEADALEPCWRHHTAIDNPLSAHGSFHSNVADDSGYVEARALTQQSPSRLSSDIIPPPDYARQRNPITPVSEYPLTQKSMQAGSLPHLGRPVSQQSKRRIRSFEQASNPALIAALPIFVQSPNKGTIRSSRVKKRRRISCSKSASSHELATQSSAGFDAQSLHPEADPELVLQHLQDMIPSGGEIRPLGQFWPQARSGGHLQTPSTEGAAVSVGQDRALNDPAAEKRGITPSAYATPFSGAVAVTGDQDNGYQPSDSGDDDWAGVDGEHSTSDTDQHEIDDDMSDDESNDSNLLQQHGAGDDDLSEDELLAGHDEDEDMISSEDELQLDF